MSKIGLIIGGGAGPELGEVFRRGIRTLATKFGRAFEIEECPRRPQSYTERRGWSGHDIEMAMKDDIRSLGEFYEGFRDSGGRAIFRAPINAEALYAARMAVEEVKTAVFEISGKRILLVRDLHQGFYSNSAWHVGDDRIDFSGNFSRRHFANLLSFGRAQATKDLRPGFKVVLLYKHHLFANTMFGWVQNLDPDALILQPGMGFVWLNHHFKADEEDVLVIAGNEIGDLIHEFYLEGQPRQSRCTAISKNYFLRSGFENLFEYQTIHGSADDVAGTGRVNPVATLRAVAAIAKDVFDAPAPAALEEAIIRAISNGILDEQADSLASTSIVAEYLITTTVSCLG